MKTALIVRCVRWRKDERLFFPIPVEVCFSGWSRHGDYDDRPRVSKSFWWRKIESGYILLGKFTIKLSLVSACFDLFLQFRQMTGRGYTVLAVFQVKTAKI